MCVNSEQCSPLGTDHAQKQFLFLFIMKLTYEFLNYLHTSHVSVYVAQAASAAHLLPQTEAASRCPVRGAKRLGLPY